MSDVNILVVDDEEVVVESCRRALTALGFAVDTANSVDPAIEKLEKKNYDVIILDIVMPKRGGIELLKIIKHSYSQTQVIMITGYTSIQTAVESIKLGAVDYLSKPFAPSELIMTVQKALQEKGRLSQPFISDKEIPTQLIFENIIGNSPKIAEVFKLISKVAPTDTTVLINGESGTGKEIAARAIHNNSRRRDHDFVVVDCLSLSQTLLESELFGHIKGSFTGAVSTKSGFFKVANHGTLFLDEIGDLSFDLQGKLLRVIQERKYIPVGGTKQEETDFRLIAATNKNLKKMVETGTFREDLFYRLYVVPLFMPPLRDRKEDIPQLVEHFMRKFSAMHKRIMPRISDMAMSKLLMYKWPGNIRQLENTIERALIHSDGDEIHLRDLPESIRSHSQEAAREVPKDVDELKNATKKLREDAVVEVEKEFLVQALSTNDWNVSKAAKTTKMQRTNFHRLMKKYDIRLPKNIKEDFPEDDEG